MMSNCQNNSPKIGTHARNANSQPQPRHGRLGLNRPRGLTCPGSHLPSGHHTLGPDGPARSRGVTRRRFLRNSALGIAGLVAAPHFLPLRSARAGMRNSKIVRTCHDEATSGMWNVHQWPVDLMVHAAIRELTGISQTSEAWKSLFPGIDASKTIAIKINLACGDVPTHPQIVNAIIDGLLMMDLGGQRLPENHIIVWDDMTSFMCPQNGYTVNYGGEDVQYYGTDYPGVGYDTNYTFTIQHPYTTSDHHPSSIITQRCDYLINAAVIKDHSDSGVTLCLKNHYGSFDNICIYETHQHYYHGDGHTRGEPELNRVLRDELGDKTKLWLIDGTLGLYDGGPGYTPPWHTPPNWAYNSFIVGRDVVAIDRIATIKINEERANQEPPLPALDPSHVYTSAGPPYDLGTDDPAEIDLVEIDLSAQSAPEGSLGPEGIALLPPYPNPSRGTLTLRLHCACEAAAELTIVDASGALVQQIRAGRIEQGVHRFHWNGRDRHGRAVPSGAYFCRLRARGMEARERVVLVR